MKKGIPLEITHDLTTPPESGLSPLLLKHFPSRDILKIIFVTDRFTIHMNIDWVAKHLLFDDQN